MKLTNQQTLNRIVKAKDLEEQIKALKAQLDAVKDELRDAMGDTERVNDEKGRFYLYYQFEADNRFDTTTFKKEEPTLYAKYYLQRQKRVLRFDLLTR